MDHLSFAGSWWGQTMSSSPIQIIPENVITMRRIKLITMCFMVFWEAFRPLNHLLSCYAACLWVFGLENTCCLQSVCKHIMAKTRMLHLFDTAVMHVLQEICDVYMTMSTWTLEALMEVSADHKRLVSKLFCSYDLYIQLAVCGGGCVELRRQSDATSGQTPERMSVKKI